MSGLKGGRGQCRFCHEWWSNVAYHEAHTCHKRPELSGEKEVVSDSHPTRQNELLPCPFCGRAPSHYEHLHMAACLTQGCPAFDNHVSDSRWNKRAAISVSDGGGSDGSGSTKSFYAEFGNPSGPFTVQPERSNKLAECVELLMVTCADQQSWEEAKELLREYYASGSPKSEVPPAAAEELLKDRERLEELERMTKWTDRAGRVLHFEFQGRETLRSAIDAAREAEQKLEEKDAV